MTKYAILVNEQHNVTNLYRDYAGKTLFFDAISLAFEFCYTMLDKYPGTAYEVIEVTF